MSRSTVAKIEAGDTTDPGFSVVARLLAAVGASDEEVLALHRGTVCARQPSIFGIGYEGLDLPGLIKDLHRLHVTVVADVRLTPLSRKKGLSKSALRDGLAAANIGYVHLPALGNPKENRAGYSDPGNERVRDSYRARLTTSPAGAHLAELRRLAEEEVVAVLCFESDERQCHREQVLAAVAS